ncbi:ABC transporter ATP-binding protein [Aurantimonas sp. 22II-16-19i]|uniref:ABC transporter ATP-binding protein n=1 Tax=Aurantimonas sp. 22II-16-19i TaxID=1317114 RepID=UPI0009F7FE65|nr:ABC transporter ATP-binding protein [Aurantimonas sp. 22II-16-19i]ORE93978.1 putative ABC transporter ATP-binding protein [Aurantimonas sp. 22II-16-19i]
MALSFQDVTKRYGGTTALDGLSLDVAPKSFTVISGPPKSGKSVLFRLLVGLENPDSGRIMLDGRDISTDAPADRPVGYVPQNFALYPHQTVAQNMGYPLTLAKFDKAEIARRVDRTAGILSITHLLKKTPDQLSGGEKQRVAVARGLLKDASIFVLDDPLVGLDYKLRERLMDELKGLRDELDATFVYATSDSLEALTMAQNLAVIDAGRIVQHGEADDVYHQPSHYRSLDLVGFPHANLFDGRIEKGNVVAGPLRFPAPPGAAEGPIKAGLRPEDVRLDAGAFTGAPAEARLLTLQARVSLVENLGGEAVVYLDCAGHSLTAAMPLYDAPPPRIDTDLAATVDPDKVLLFGAGTGERLRGPAPTSLGSAKATRERSFGTHG